MSYAASLRLPAFAVAVPKRRVAALKEAADLGVLWMLRLALLAFVTYDGALILRNVTRAMCDASGHPAPAWTRN
jgi:hypothetical protein